MNNAVKFTNYGGRIILRITSRGTHTKISVIDDGIGIESSRLAMIRRVLLRKDLRDIPSEVYLGLGLKVSNMIVKGFVGTDSNLPNTLEIESTIHKGTVVSFNL